MSQTSTTSELAQPAPLSAPVDVLAVLALVQAASPGPWEADTETNDAGFRSYVMTDGSNCRLFDSLNAEACVATEGDEDGVYHWDITAERNFKAAAAAVEFVRLHGAAIAELIEAAGKAQDTNRDDYALARPDVSHLPEDERAAFLRGWDAASEAVYRTGLRAALRACGGAQ